MVRQLSVFALLAAVTGCSSEGVGTETAAPGGDSVEVGQTQQKAQFADNTVINLVDPGTAILTLTADIQPVDVNVFYVSDKTTDAGHQAGNVNLVTTISLAADQTKQYTVNLLDPAFYGGYGALVLDSVGNTPLDVFQTYVEYGGATFSTGGSVFTGGSYRVPYRSGTIKVVLALTNQSDFDFDVTIQNVGTTMTRTITLPVLSTYRFDSLGEGWVLSGTNSIQVTTTAGGTVSVSGYIDRLFNRVRVTPVKAAPYFSN